MSVASSIRDPLAEFNRWRRGRPFAGGVLLLLAATVIAYVSLEVTSELPLIGGSSTGAGLLFGGLVGCCGVAVLARPAFSSPLGILGVVFAIMSLFGSLGGLGLGLILGIVGGNLCVAWVAPDGVEEDLPDDGDASDGPPLHRRAVGTAVGTAEVVGSVAARTGRRAAEVAEDLLTEESDSTREPAMTEKPVLTEESDPTNYPAATDTVEDASGTDTTPWATLALPAETTSGPSTSRSSLRTVVDHEPTIPYERRPTVDEQRREEGGFIWGEDRE